RSVGVSFFFQAEDGIRYPLVTGVQTCALPIFTRGARPIEIALSTLSESTSPRRAPRVTSSTGLSMSRTVRSTGSPATSMRVRTRSEERRVGKERSAGHAGVRELVDVTVALMAE